MNGVIFGISLLSDKKMNALLHSTPFEQLVWGCAHSLWQADSIMTHLTNSESRVPTGLPGNISYDLFQSMAWPGNIGLLWGQNYFNENCHSEYQPRSSLRGWGRDSEGQRLVRGVVIFSWSNSVPHNWQTDRQQQHFHMGFQINSNAFFTSKGICNTLIFFCKEDSTPTKRILNKKLERQIAVYICNWISTRKGQRRQPGLVTNHFWWVQSDLDIGVIILNHQPSNS